MVEKIRDSFIVLPCILIGLAAACIAYDAHLWSHTRADKMALFEELLGGVGMGAISSPLYNFINYDPRIQPVDDSITWPVPGIYSYGPDRTATVSYFEEIPQDQLIEKTLM